jgi:hypothetical protein
MSLSGLRESSSEVKEKGHQLGQKEGFRLYGRPLCSFFRMSLCSRYLHGRVQDETKVLGNRWAQFPVTTAGKKSFRVTVCATSNLRQRHFSMKL